MSSSTRNPGWVVRTVSPQFEYIGNPPVPTLRKEDFLEEAGFGFEVIKGAQFVRKLELETGRNLFGTRQDEWSDGAVLPCPSGFERIKITWDNNVLQGGYQELVLRVIKRPAAVFTREQGLGAHGAVQIFPSLVNLKPGDTAPTLPALGSGLLIDVPNLRYMIKDTLGAGEFYKARDVGDADNRVLVTPALFVRGHVCATAAFKLTVYAYNGFPNGVGAGTNCILFTVAATDTSAGAPVVPDYPYVAKLMFGSAAYSPIQVPINGFKIYVTDTGGAGLTFEGDVHVGVA